MLRSIFLVCALMPVFVMPGMVRPYPGMREDPPSYDSSSGTDGYEDSSSSGGYGGGSTTETKTRCTPFFETVSSQHCEPYTEKVCRTTQKEACSDVADQNCRAIWKNQQTRKCFDVEEQHCTLKEQVKFESVQVGFTVQKCHKVPERVCDRVYETHSTTTDHSQCISIDNPQCKTTDETIYDKTCRTTTIFDCQQKEVVSGGGGYGGETQTSSGGYGSTDSYGDSGSQTDAYGNSNDYSANTGGYGHTETQTKVHCDRRQETKCYKTPRLVHRQVCGRSSEKICEKVAISHPMVKERQNCRNEDKKVCVLEERSQPKQVKKYVYTKQCRTVPRKVCENADQKQLVPSCVGITRKHCTYNPVEQCEELDKQHCFNVDRQVKKQKCETYTVPSTTSDYESSTGGYE